MTIPQIYSAENTQRQHLLRGKLRLKIGMEMFSYGLTANILIPGLHAIMHNNDPHTQVRIIWMKNHALTDVHRLHQLVEAASAWRPRLQSKEPHPAVPQK